jgi:hypothetical protein
MRRLVPGRRAVKMVGLSAFDAQRCFLTSQPVEPEPSGDTFRGQADSPRPGLIAEFWAFLKYNKKWWLLPILIAVLLLGGLVALSGTALAPFIYPLV